MVTNENVKEALGTLRYDARWLEYGFLDEALLQRQIDYFSTSEDQGTEHYRYAAFQIVLHNHPALDDTEVGQYVELAQADEDQLMAGAALADLIGWAGLSPHQFNALSHHPIFQTRPLQRMAQRKRLLVELRDSPLTDDMFTHCLAAHDLTIQRTLLERPDLAKPQLTALQEKGCSRAVRNIANVRLNRSTQTVEKRR